MNKILETEIIQLHAEVCGGLADPTRIMILYALSQKPHNVSELASELNMPQPTVSRHLKILRDRGMVTAERQGSTVLYTLNDARLIQALDLLRAIMRDNLAKRAALSDVIS